MEIKNFLKPAHYRDIDGVYFNRELRRLYVDSIIFLPIKRLGVMERKDDYAFFS